MFQVLDMPLIKQRDKLLKDFSKNKNKYILHKDASYEDFIRHVIITFPQYKQNIAYAS